MVTCTHSRSSAPLRFKFSTLRIKFVFLWICVMIFKSGKNGANLLTTIGHQLSKYVFNHFAVHTLRKLRNPPATPSAGGLRTLSQLTKLKLPAELVWMWSYTNMTNNNKNSGEVQSSCMFQLFEQIIHVFNTKVILYLWHSTFPFVFIRWQTIWIIHRHG